MAATPRRRTFDIPATLRSIVAELNEQFVERDDAIWVTLCTILAGEHVFWLGPFGSAKSQLLEELTSRFSARAAVFQLHAETSETSLFGPVDVARYDREGVWERDLEGGLGAVEFALLDELFKAGKGVRDSMLRAVHERRYRNGKSEVELPLMSIVGASNELGDAASSAFWDRFLTRLEVAYIESDRAFADFMTADDLEPSTRTTLPLAALRQAMVATSLVEIGDDVISAIVALRRRLRSAGVQASDRRWRQSRKLLRAAAYLDGRPAVSLDDLALLQHVLWSTLEEQPVVVEYVLAAAGHSAQELAKASAQLREIETKITQHVDRPHAVRTAFGANAEFQLRELDKAMAALPSGPRVDNIRAELQARVLDLRGRVYTELLNMTSPPDLRP